MSGYVVPVVAYRAIGFVTVNFYTFDEDVAVGQWFGDVGLTENVTVGTNFYSPVVGFPFDGTIGPFTIPADVDSITVNFVSSSGFYKLDRNNEIYIEAGVRVVVEETDSNGLPLGPSITTNITYTSNSNKTTAQAAQTLDIDNPYDFAKISCVRTTARDKSDNISNVDQIVWRDLYFINNVGPTVPDNSSIAQVAVQSNTASQGVKARQVNMDLTRYITPYIGNGQFGAETPVSTVAEVSIALALDPLNGRLTLDDIDADLLLSVQEQLKAYYGNDQYVEVGYHLDSTTLRFQDSFNLLWNAVNCKAYAQDAVYKVYPDIERTASSKQFTHRNKIVGSDKRDRRFSSKDNNDGVELTLSLIHISEPTRRS